MEKGEMEEQKGKRRIKGRNKEGERESEVETEKLKRR